MSSGLDASKPLDQLTADEAKSACRSLAASVDEALPNDDLRRYACTLLGAVLSVQSKPDGSFGIDKATCARMTDECLADARNETVTKEDECEAGTATTDLMSCTATVGELEGCLDAAIARIRSQLDMVSCDSPVSTVASPAQEMKLPECAEVEAKCPGLVDQLTPEMESMQGTGSGFLDLDPIGPGGCTDSCTEAMDGFCDDGGEGSDFDGCGYGTDCTDCGERPAN